MPQLFSALRVLGRHTVMKSALGGEWTAYRDCHVKPDLVLIYQKAGAGTLRLVRLRSHQDIQFIDDRDRRALMGRPGDLAGHSLHPNRRDLKGAGCARRAQLQPPLFSRQAGGARRSRAL